MSDAAERLVNLALLLASNKEYVTAEECRSAGLGYPDHQDTATFLRMFERDKDALRAAGLVIDVALDPDTDTEAYRLDAKATYARPVELTSAELSALRSVAAAFAADPSFPFPDDLALALGKLGASGNETSLATTDLAEQPASGDAVVVRALAEAVRIRKAVTFTYTNSRGVRRQRTIDPYGLFLREGQWYVTGRDADAEDVRTFSVERIEDLDVNPARPRTPDFERPAEFDVREQERLPFQYGPSAFEVRLRFTPDVAWRAERLSRGHGRIDALADGSVVWTVDATDLERLGAWLIDEGPGIHPVDPPELLATLSTALRQVIADHA